MSDHDPVPSPAQQYIDEMARSRGFALPYHRLMAAADFDVLRTANDLVNNAYLKQRTLDPKTKELLFVVSLVTMRASRDHIATHIRHALKLGLTPTEILEAIEITLPEAGVVVFQVGVEIWAEVVGAEGMEPSDGVTDKGQPESS